MLFASIVTASGAALPLLPHSATATVHSETSSLTLDPAGKTVPDTNYPIPQGAVFMAPNGSDNNNGTQGSPVKTLNKAVSLVGLGGTIVARAGTYRDWLNSGGVTYSIGGKGITIQNYPHEQVWFDGTDVVPAGQWVNAGGGRWYKNWSTPQFCDAKYYQLPPTSQSTSNTGPCSNKDMSASPQAPVAGDPQMAFVNGTRLAQKPSLAEINSSSFYYDWTARRIYIATDPAGKTIELAARPVAIVLGGSNTNGNTVRGIGFRRYATNQYRSLTGAALYLGGSGPNKVENTAFAQNAGGALSFSNPRPGSYVRSSVFSYNGFTALGANGGAAGGTRNDLLIEKNLFNGNNSENFGQGCTISCSHANVKLGHMNGFTFRTNIVENAVGTASGFWCDLDCRDGVMVNNLLRDNGGVGINYEVSSRGNISSNLVTGSGRPGIVVASATTKVYNNTLVDNQFGIWVYDDRRARGVDGWTDVGPNTTDVELVNNIVWDEPYYLVKSSQPTRDLSINTVPSQYYSQFDYNAYYRVNGPSQFLQNWIEGSDTYYKSSSEFRAAKGWDGHSLDISSGGDPFFVDKPGGDFRLHGNSPAFNSGKPLPADVAAALGVPAGAVISRGAISWPTPS